MFKTMDETDLRVSECLFNLCALLEHLEKNIVWIALNSSEEKVEVKRLATRVPYLNTFFS